MCRAPMHAHQMPDTDFLVCVPRGKKAKKAYLREVSVYSVGKVEPLLAVNPPGSRGGNDFKNKRIQAHIYRLFTTIRKDGEIPRVRIAEVLHEFHSHSETSIRKRLKECSDFQRGGNDSGWWTVKEGFKYPTEDELMKMVEPEQLCSFESMQAGQQSLVDLGVDKLTQVKEVGRALSQMNDEEQLQLIGEFILTRLSMAPWTVTNAYKAARDRSGQLPHHELRQIAVRTNDSFSLEVPRPNYESSNAIIQQLTRLSRTQAGEKLLHSFGVAKEEVQKHSRFDRLGLIRRIHNWEHKKPPDSQAKILEAQQGKGRGKDRDAKWTIAKQAEMHAFEMKQAFDKQDAKLHEMEPEFSSDEQDTDEQDDEVDYDDFAASMEEALESDKKTTKKKRKLHFAPNEDQQREANDMTALLETTEEAGGPIEAPMLQESARPPVPAHGGAKQIKNGKRIRILMLKKTIRADPETMQLRTTYEYVTDPQEVDKQLKRDAKTRAARTQMTAEEHNRMTDERREKRRLQEMKRRLEKRAIVEANGGYPPRGGANRKGGDSKPKESNCNSRCSACGALGHMKTNRKCPKYNITDEMHVSCA